MPIHRTLKNVVKNHTFAEVKVREATSNDPWGPSTTLMSEIADLTYNSVALPEVMQMIWKRLNDSGKNWRHVYKSLVLLDYLVKTGNERVAQQCKESILTIQTLKDFQYTEEGKDHGQNVRDKAKSLSAILQDDERFKNERTKALSAKDRYAANTGALTGARREMSHSDKYLYASSTQAARSSPEGNKSEIESVRPSNPGEEDLQLQLALAMSKEEHDEDMKRRMGDELKLQMAIEESKKHSNTNNTGGEPVQTSDSLLDFGSPPPMGAGSRMPASATWDSGLSHQTIESRQYLEGSGPTAFDPWGAPVHTRSNPPAPVDQWGMSMDLIGSSHQSSAVSSTKTSLDPWNTVQGSAGISSIPAGQSGMKPVTGPWDQPAFQPSSTINGSHTGGGGGGAGPGGLEDEFDLLCAVRSKSPTGSGPSFSAAFDPFGGGHANNADMVGGSSVKKTDDRKTPEGFLGANANLVNLNDLVTKPPQSGIINPFAMTTRTQSPAPNLFAARAQQEEQSRRVPIGQLHAAQSAAVSYTQPSASYSVNTTLPAPLIPSWPAAAGQPEPMFRNPPQQVAYQSNPPLQMYPPQQPAALYQQQQAYPQQNNPFL